MAVDCLHLYNCVLEIAPDQASGEGLARGYFGFAPTSGPDQSPEIQSLGRGAATPVGCSWFGFLHYALAIAPDYASGEIRAERYFGFAQTSGPDQSPPIKSLRLGAATTIYLYI